MIGRGKRVPFRTSQSTSAANAFIIIIFVVLCIVLFYNDLKEFGKSLLEGNGDSKNGSPHVYMREYSRPFVDNFKFDANVPSINSVSSRSPQQQIEEACNDPVWCSIPMPTLSYFKFAPPDDPLRWRRAQIQASKGEQVFLKRISKVFPHPLDFLDGDRSFRKLHSGVDVFVDERTWLSPLTVNGAIVTKSEKPFDWEKENRRVIPRTYDFINANRSPIAQVGYITFRRDKNQYFAGNFEAGAFTTRQRFIQEWNNVRDKLIDKPIIVECALNENWGWLSTNFPNRTVAWGQCCTRPQDKYVRDFLDDDKLLMVIVGQHHNVSHPKVISIPRGLPLTWQYTEKLIWDSIRIMQTSVKKEKLLFASASSWGPRPQILKCVSNKFTVADFEGHVDTDVSEMQKTKLDRGRYYEKLASAKFGLNLPGLGYDCFRTWELLTLGTVVVTERGVGLDRTFWRLPVLLVDDFAYVTPELLRTAYVEAVYRADDFEFERLKQSFWWSVFMNVSRAGNIQPLLDKFPMEAEDSTFTRPREPYSCAHTDTCGPGTKRIPLKSC